MKKPVPRKFKVPGAPNLPQPPIRIEAAATRVVPPKTKLPRVKLPELSQYQPPLSSLPRPRDEALYFTPIQPPRPQNNAYAPLPVQSRYPDPLPPSHNQPMEQNPPTEGNEEPLRAIRRPQRRSAPPEHARGFVPGHFISAGLGALFMFLCAMLPAAFGVDVFGIGRMLGIAQSRQAASARSEPPPPAAQTVSKREFDAVRQRLVQVTERLASLERSVDVLAERSAEGESGLSEQTPVVEQQSGLGASDQVVKKPPEPVAAAPVTPEMKKAEAKAGSTTAAQSSSGEPKADRVSFTLKPGQGAQVTLAMAKDSVVKYAWTVRGGLVNYNMLGRGDDGTTTYKSRNESTNDNGDLIAAFAGEHGWLWRNGGTQDVVITLATRGAYTQISGVP